MVWSIGRVKNSPGITFSLALFQRCALPSIRQGSVFVAALIFGTALHASEALFHDRLNQPAPLVGAAQTRPVLSITEAGTRLVAVGLRGLILVSDDGGLTWRQSPSSVSSDLTSVHFVSGQQGWVVGHDGVILHSEDGGDTWVKQLDGRQAQGEFMQHYQRLVDSGQPQYQKYLDELATNFRTGPSLPYLGIWFDNERVGYAVGSFGMLAKTVNGGSTWEPWLDHIDNSEALNLNAVRRIDGELYLVGERGAVFRLDEGNQRFLPLPSGYQGSFFGISGGGGVLLTYGLRGTVWRSVDRGHSWSPVNSGITGAISDGDSSADGRQIVLASATGAVLESSDAGLSFHALTAPALAYAGVRLHAGTAVLASLQGISTLQLTLPQSLATH